jgi:hypothetical protein
MNLRGAHRGRMSWVMEEAIMRDPVHEDRSVRLLECWGRMVFRGIEECRLVVHHGDGI